MKKIFGFLALATLLTAALIPTPAVAASSIGIDYIPLIPGGNGGSAFLRNAEWTTANKLMIQADLNQLVSMGVTCQRMFFWSECNGWVIDQYPNPHYFSSEFTEALNNLPEYLGYFADRKIKVDFCFGNDWFTGGPGGGQSWWAWAYGSGGWSTFLADSLYWMQHLVDAVEASPYASNVIFYDMQNEVYTTPAWTNYPEYTRQVFDNGHVPAAKKGFSVLRVPPTGTTDYDTLKTSAWLGSTRASALKMTDSHCYPELDSNDWNLEGKYDKARSTFPNSTTIIGEYAYSDSAAGEPTQATNVLNLTNKIITKNIPYAMNWWFVDSPTATAPTFGLAKGDINHPKDVMGVLVDRLSLFSNGNMEQDSGGMPTGWGGGSNGGHPLEFWHGGPDYNDSCTGARYFRLTSHYPGDNIYTLSPYTAIPAGGSYVYPNAYIRSSCANVYIGVHQYDANGTWLSFTGGPKFTPGDWSWHSYQQAVNGWRFAVNPNARYVYLGVIADVTADPGYLDTDCVSLQVR